MYYREYRTFAHTGASFGLSEAQAGASSPIWKYACWPTSGFHLERKQHLRSGTHWQGVVIDVGECAVEKPKKAARLLLGQEEAAHAKSAGAP